MQEVIEVRIANFDVVVTDREGKHVRGLSRDDFELYEDGKLQEITNLSEFAEGPADQSGPAAPLPAAGSSEAASAEAPPGRQVVIFFDILTTSTFERKRAIESMGRFVAGLRPQDQVMILSWNRSLKIVVPPTNDAARLREGFTRVQKELSLSRLRGATVGMLPGPAGSPQHSQMPLQLAARAEWREPLEAARAVLEHMRGLQGRKALLLFTKGFGLPDPSTEEAPEQMELLRLLAKTANDGGVPLYGIHAGGLDSGWDAGDAAASPTGGMVEALPMARGQASGAATDGLRYLAHRTGGRAAANTNYFAAALDTIRSELGNYYSLGYRVQARRINAEREIVIKTRNPAYTARARRTFAERTYDDEVAHEVRANLFFPRNSNDLEIAASLGRADRKKRNRFALDVNIRIPYSSLSYVGDERAADIAVFIGSVDSRGSTSSVVKFDHRVRLRSDAPAYTYSFEVDLRADPGDHRVSVAVFDKTSKATGYATVEVPKLK